MILGRTERVFATFDVTVTDSEGASVSVTTVGLALTAPRRSPDVDTEWADAAVTAGSVTVLLAGPDADPDGALPVPAGGADLWARLVDAPETVTVKVERISLR